MSASERTLTLIKVAAEAANDKKATELIALDVSDRLPLADAFLIASGSNERQVSAIADGIIEALLEHKVKAIREEGKREGRWVLLDFNDLIVHVMHAEDRVYYELERLWKDCPVIELPEFDN